MPNRFSTWPRPRECSSSTVRARAATCRRIRRSCKEILAGGGMASGPVSLHEGLRRLCRCDQVGRQDPPRRQDGHPRCPSIPTSSTSSIANRSKKRKAWALIDAGYEGGFNIPGGAYELGLLPERQSLGARYRRVHEAVEEDASGRRRRCDHRRSHGDPPGARSDEDDRRGSTWMCGDPGMQFDTTINEWHTCPNTDRINASNPCSEYMFLDDTACNLASLNLMSFLRPRRRVRRRELPPRL